MVNKKSESSTGTKGNKKDFFISSVFNSRVLREGEVKY